MSSKALEILDRIINKVEKLPTSFITHTPDDIAWGPHVPKGHSEYTWAGDDDAQAYNPIGNQSHKPAAKPHHPQPAQQQPKVEKKQPEQPKEKQGKQPKQSPQQQAQQAPKSPQQKPAESADGEKKENKKDKKDNNKKDKKPAEPAAAAASQSNAPNSFSRFVFKVGRVVKAEKHPNADKMYVEQIDLGEGNPRTICSGLVGLVPLEELATSDVVVVANLKPVTLKSIESNGMVLAASNAEHNKAALVKPPKGSKVGERVYLEGASDEERKYPGDDVIDLKKKDSPWGEVSQGLKTNDNGVVCFNGKPMITTAGPLTADGMPNAVVK